MPGFATVITAQLVTEPEFNYQIFKDHQNGSL
jgi:hypothetical protein